MTSRDRSRPGAGPDHPERGRARSAISSRVSLLAAALLIAGCAELAPVDEGPQPGAPAEPIEQAAPAEAPARDTARSGAPSTSGDNLYKLLVAEIAGRRGRLDMSLENYLEVARETRDPAVAERAVRIAVFARDQEGGLEAANLWTQIAPDSTDARQVYAALLLRAGEVDTAVRQLDAAVPHYAGGSAEAYGRIGDMLARERDKAVAVAVMARLVGGRPDDAHAQAAFAQLLARAGQEERAIEVYEKVLALDPDDQQTLIIYARLLQRQGKSDVALATLNEALGRRPDSDRVRLTYARLLVDSKRYEDALEQFRRLSKRTPENADVRYAYGLLLLQTNAVDEAKAQFEELIARRQRMQVAHYYLGQIAEAQQDIEGALAAYRKVTEGEHRLNAQIRAAVLLAESGRLVQARAHLHGLRGDNSQQAIRIYRAEAEILAKRKDYEEAMRVYNGALASYPEDTDLLYSRAMLAEKMDNLELLERDLRSILSREPNNADALNALGYTLADRTDRYAEAYELVKRAYELKPDDHYVIDSMGWTLYRMGRLQEAVMHLRRAMELNGDPEIAAHLGEVLWMMGDKKAAHEIWDTALKSTPDDPRLLDVKKRFEQ
ncbi:MAG: tetratricopeptide repeat protein [Gammaproteobacteria bacterium]|nr:tetratricopeptide repeat protein [Gammaproteobacteria bacterium]NIM74473.1 tetratricopeptide repeat protein [Gammaproteobacteria bacterium]NIO26306.1 tetratricopeptide repeat protein [Gammaproteobacteria bacterium]NIO66858.1 tetratricopeptide repeat protein [Gammaproteobacteria bacterium]NIP45169.1 tetratricopeptide repeat protein [Gammaproteobacteria bacterium]